MITIHLKTEIKLTPEKSFVLNILQIMGNVWSAEDLWNSRDQYTYINRGLETPCVQV
jgi:hypothetical protein